MKVQESQTVAPLHSAHGWGQFRVSRHATEWRHGERRETNSLSAWRKEDAYVLLGDPGAGKTCCFKAESDACNGLPIPARDIVDNVAPEPDDGRVVFIDGLDEVRVGVADGKAPLGAIRAWLHRKGCPRFRLSCREADWLGESDRNALKRVVPGGDVTELHLEPLQKHEILAILRDRPDAVADPKAFWGQAVQFGLGELFGNPLLLDLTIEAVAETGGEWPSTRQGIYEAACRRLATEQSLEHSAARLPMPGDTDRLLDDAGLLCALLLLGSEQYLSVRPGTTGGAIVLPSIPAALQLPAAHAALASKVFATVAGRSAPRHRTIAEYLAARALAKRVDGGLPLGRLLALMQGFDGRPVEPLRGLFGWLAVHHPRGRDRLIQLDPLGIVLNGDVAALSTSERLGLLEALACLARSDRWFRGSAWVSHPFGPLATADMASDYERVLRKPDRDPGHQAFMDCLLDALRHGESMPALCAALEAWVVDPTAWISNRLAAYEAWKHNVDARVQSAKQKEWLALVAAGTMLDSGDRMMGALLTDLYPQQIAPREVLKYLHPRSGNLAAEYQMFWRRELLQQSKPHDLAALADSWAETKPPSGDEAEDFDTRNLKGKVLTRALVGCGDHVSTERLYGWLGIGLDAFGYSRMSDEPGSEVARWLEQRPDRIKAVVALGYRSTRPDLRGRRFFWDANQRLHGTRLPRDWLRWHLDLAAATDDEELARHCFRLGATSFFGSPAGVDLLTMEEIEQWVDLHANTWPRGKQWLEEAWTSRLEEPQGNLHRNQLKYKAQQLQEREERKRELGPYLASLANGTAPAGLLHQLAFAHEGRFTNIHGNTPAERVQDFLVTDAATAATALAALDRVLVRDDVPSVDDILDLDAKRKYHLIRPAALLAASSHVERTPGAPLTWPENLAKTLVAFYLTDGIGDTPAWYGQLVAQRPNLVAPILARYAASRLRQRKKDTAIAGLWALGAQADHRDLARLVLPELLHGFPLRASPAARRHLNRPLLAALHVLEDEQAALIIRLKLEQPGMDAAQRICWLVAELPYRAEAAQDLANLVGKSERRAVALGTAFDEQGSLRRTAGRMAPTAVRRLIEVLAPITRRARSSRSDWVAVANHREKTIRGLLEGLSSNPSTTARDELKTLSDSERLGNWKEDVEYSARTQQAVAREAFFQAADPASVARVIANLSPANPPDLKALVTQHLDDLGAELRGANTYLLRQFWQLNISPVKPLDENDCRDLLLEKLQDRLRSLDIRLEREASAARDKRADMNAVFIHAGKTISLPIEVKKDTHPDLWTAWRDQLHMLYTIDPSAGGYGLYLVLWFDYRSRATPEGTKPRDAEHLRELFVERIPKAERHRLGVVVMDLSLPASAEQALGAEPALRH